jgi:translation initiation factor IF-3
MVIEKKPSIQPVQKNNQQEKGPRRNHEIRVPEVRLIDDEGKMLGVLKTFEAINMAKEKGLDLIEVNPNGQPPVVKLIDYGKYKYEQKKKQQEAKKKQVVVSVKEIQFRPNTDKHDFDFKIRHIEKFIKEGDKVKVSINFKGREMEHLELANPMVDRIREHIRTYAIMESEPKLEGRRIFMLIAPAVAKA